MMSNNQDDITNVKLRTWYLLALIAALMLLIGFEIGSTQRRVDRLEVEVQMLRGRP